MTPAGMQILVACTGNLCRSPYAEAVLAGALDGSAHRVVSAGTRAVAGRAPHPSIERLISAVGLPAATHSPRQLQPLLVDSADLVLVMTRQQRSEVLRSVPRALRKTFTLKEFAWMCAHAPADVASSAGLVDSAFAARSLLPSSLRGAAETTAPTGHLDVADPYGRDDAAFLTMAREIDAAVASIAPVLLRC